MKDAQSNSPLGYALIDLKTAADATQAINHLSTKAMHGQNVPVALVRSMPPGQSILPNGLAQATKPVASSLVDEGSKQICERFESLSLSSQPKVTVHQTALTNTKENPNLAGKLSQISHVFQNPFEKPKSAIQPVKLSDIAGSMSSTAIGKKTQTKEQTRSPEVKVEQKTVDSLALNFDKFKSRVAELEETVTTQRVEIENQKANQRSHERRHVDEATRLEKEKGALQKQALKTENTMNEQKIELVELREKSAKIQHDLIDTRQRLDLARNEVKSHKKLAENTAAAQKDVVSQLEHKIAKLEADISQSNSTVQQRRAVMLQSQVEDLKTQHDKEIKNLEKARKRIAELEEANSEIKHLKAEANVSKCKTDSLEIDVENLKQRILDLENEARSKDTKIAQAESRRRETSIKLTDLVSEISRLKTQASAGQTKMDSLTYLLQDMKNQHVAARLDCSAKADQLRIAECAVNELEQQQKALIKTGQSKQSLKKDINRLKSERGQDHKYIDELEDDLQREREYANELKNDISSITQQLDDETRRRRDAEVDACYYKRRADERYYYHR